MTAMKPRTPTASQSVGTYYNSNVAYQSALTYNQASSSGANANSRTVPVATMKAR